jgi:hypothetical protein
MPASSTSASRAASPRRSPFATGFRKTPTSTPSAGSGKPAWFETHYKADSQKMKDRQPLVS